MASPHVAGVAAIARQAHPTWSGNELAAAIVNTGRPASIVGTTPYRTSRAGTGLVFPFGVMRTQAVAFAGQQIPAANFGFYESEDDFSGVRTIRVWNKGAAPMTFDVGTSNVSGSPHTLTPSAATVTAAPGTFGEVNVTLAVPMATAGSAAAFREVSGLVTFTPQGGANNNIALRVPYYLVPRPSSLVDISVADSTPDSPTFETTATVTNDADAAVTGTADFYAWGLRDGQDADGSPADMRAIGVQSFDDRRWCPAHRLRREHVAPLVERVDDRVRHLRRRRPAERERRRLHRRRSRCRRRHSGRLRRPASAASCSARGAQERAGSWRPHRRTGARRSCRRSRTQFCRAGEPCLSAANPRFTYHAVGFDLNEEEEDDMPLSARFNPWTPSIFTDNEFDFIPVAPGDSDSTTVTIDRPEWNQTPARGLMVIVNDNKSGELEAKLIDVRPASRSTGSKRTTKGPSALRRRGPFLRARSTRCRAAARR